MVGTNLTLKSGSTVIVLKVEHNTPVGTIITCRRIVDTPIGPQAEPGKPLRLPLDCFKA